MYNYNIYVIITCGIYDINKELRDYFRVHDMLPTRLKKELLAPAKNALPARDGNGPFTCPSCGGRDGASARVISTQLHGQCDGGKETHTHTRALSALCPHIHTQHRERERPGQLISAKLVSFFSFSFLMSKASLSLSLYFYSHYNWWDYISIARVAPR